MKRLAFLTFLLGFLAATLAVPSRNNNTVLGVSKIGTPEDMIRIKDTLIRRRLEDRMISSNTTKGLIPTSTLSSPIGKRTNVVCDDPARKLEPSDLEVVQKYWADWCAAGNKVPPFRGYYANWGDVRLSVCNYGWYNPCSNDEINNAWKEIDKKCPKKDGKPVSGNWYEPDWLKAYERSHCLDSKVCGKPFIACDKTEEIGSVSVT